MDSTTKRGKNGRRKRAKGILGSKSNGTYQTPSGSSASGTTTKDSNALETTSDAISKPNEPISHAPFIIPTTYEEEESYRIQSQLHLQQQDHDNDNLSTNSSEVSYIPFHSHHQQRFPTMKQRLRLRRDMHKRVETQQNTVEEKGSSSDVNHEPQHGSVVFSQTVPNLRLPRTAPSHHEVSARTPSIQEKVHLPPTSLHYSEDYMNSTEIRSRSSTADTRPTHHPDPHPNSSESHDTKDIHQSFHHQRTHPQTAPLYNHHHLQSSIKNTVLFGNDMEENGVPSELDTVRLVSRHELLNQSTSFAPINTSDHTRKGNPHGNRNLHAILNAEKSQSKNMTAQLLPHTTQRGTNVFSFLDRKDNTPTLDDLNSMQFSTLSKLTKRSIVGAKTQDVQKALTRNTEMISQWSKYESLDQAIHVGEDSPQKSVRGPNTNLVSYLVPQSDSELENSMKCTPKQVLSFLSTDDEDARQYFLNNITTHLESGCQFHLRENILLDFDYVRPRFMDSPQELLDEFRGVRGFPYNCRDGLRYVYDALVGCTPYFRDTVHELCSQLMQRLLPHSSDSLVKRFMRSVQENLSRSSQNASLLSTNSNDGAVPTIATKNSISGTCVSQDEQFVFSWNLSSCSVSAWNLSDASHAGEYSFPGKVLCAALSSSEGILFTAFHGGNVRADLLFTHETVGQIKLPDEVTCIMAIPNSTNILVVYRNKIDYFAFNRAIQGRPTKWKRRDQWKLIQTFCGHIRPISKITFCQDVLISVCQDMRIRKYSLNALCSLPFGTEYEHHKKNIKIESSKDDKRVVDVRVVNYPPRLGLEGEAKTRGSIVVCLPHHTLIYDLMFGNVITEINHAESINECLIDFPFMYTHSEQSGNLKRINFGENEQPFTCIDSHHPKLHQVTSMQLILRAGKRFIIFSSNQTLHIVNVDDEKNWVLPRPRKVASLIGAQLKSQPVLLDVTRPQSAELMPFDNEHTLEMTHLSQTIGAAHKHSLRKQPSFLGISLSTSKKSRRLDRKISRQKRHLEEERKHKHWEEMHSSWISQRKRWNALSLLKNKSSDVAELDANSQIPGLKNLKQARLEQYVVPGGL
eukprot:CAMPEP_0117454130 /NCGR_PEP_ID=MMETSP0759-20121206/10637_1 /TAXON_ID=63605 /ORGANISM="Percolomonas cosmopolitus, Strain WS" /LENGTH=1081 /DNA_ID=CAMNT_0005247297 /DNA_START=446 /DNA_END=3691 /DNA_ORIENTATION=-